MNLVDWIYHRWNRWIDDPLTGEQTLRHLSTFRPYPPVMVIARTGEWIVDPNSWLGQFYLASFDMRDAADRVEWDWPSWD